MKRIKLLIMWAMPLLAAMAISSCEPEKEEITVDKVEWDADLKATQEGKKVDTDQAPFSVADKVTVTPETAADVVVTYDSSNKDVATISAEGVITVLSVGTTNITATAGGKSDVFLLTVVEPDPDAVAVDNVEWDAELKAGLSVMEGAASFSVADRVSVTPDEATDKSLTFDSTDEEVATISTTGIIMIFGQGTTEISATAHNGESDVFILTVTEDTSVAVESVAWDAELKEGVTIMMGQPLDVSGKATVLPEDATGKTVTYSSSDPSVASVNVTGVINPLKPGTTTIKAMAGEVEDTFLLTVTISVALDAYLTPASIVVPVGATNRIWAHVNVSPMPTDLKAKDIVFTSSDEGIATVDQYGVIIGVAPGDAKITVAASNNAEAKAELDVKVANVNYYPRTAAEGNSNPWTLTSNPVITPADDTKPRIEGLFDGDFTSPNQHSVSWGRQGKYDLGEGWDLTITVDVKDPTVVNVFKIIQRDNPYDNRSCNIYGFDEIAGSNDGVNFTPIVTMIEVTDAMSPVEQPVCETTFTNDTPYQYYRFTCRTVEFCYVHGLSTGGDTEDESKYKYPGIRQQLTPERTPSTKFNHNGIVRVFGDDAGNTVQFVELYLGKY